MTAPGAPRTALAAHRPSPTLLGLGAVASAGLALSALYAATGLGVPCAFRAITGWDCPFCGGTRMGAALLHGDVSSAWAFNPFALVGLVLAAILGAWLLIEHATARTGLLARRTHEVASRLGLRLTPTTVTVGAGIILAAWTLVRNLALGPLP